MDINDFVQKLMQWLLTSGLRVLLIVILTLIALKLASFVSARLLRFSIKSDDIEFKKRIDTLSSITQNLLIIAIVFVGAIVVLGELGVEIGPVLAAAGIVGLAVGFGAQSLVQDVITGFFILLEDQIRVGDVVQVGDKGGIVEKVTLRTVILRDLSGNVHFIRNGQIQVVTNLTKDYSRYVFDIGVAYKEDVDRVIEIVRQVDETMRNHPDFKEDILEPMEILGLDQFADSAVIIKARVKTKPIRQWAVGREFNRLLKKRFDQENIEIPFPHVTVYIGQGEQGNLPPLKLSLKGEPSSSSGEAAEKPQSS